MAADYTAYSAILKEVWHPDRLESSIYQENPFLEKLEKKKPTISIGDKCLTPVQLGRSGGYGAVPRTGSATLNAADEQKVNAAEYTWTHHWFQVQIDTATVDETQGKAKAVAEVVETEIGGALDDLRKQLTRQLVGGNGDALIAQCTTGGASTTVNLLSTGDGYDAIVRGWLYPGLKVDVGTTAAEASLVGDSEITAVSESVSTPTITISDSITTSSSHYISVANNRSGTTSYETNGLRNIVGTSTLATLNPSTYPVWQSYVDTTTQDLTLPLVYRQRREVYQRTGKNPNWVITSPVQMEALSLLLQTQMRFDSASKMDTGGYESAQYAGMTIDCQPDVRDRDWFTLSKDCLFVLRTEAPAWASQKYGGSREPIEWQQGTTKLVGGLVYRMQLATSRRNAHAALTGLNR